MPSLLLIALAAAAPGADPDLKALFEEGIPKSPFIAAVYKHAGALLERGDRMSPDQDLIRLLFFLGELSGEEKYSRAAEAALR
ncbi:MAG: hypothetical protein ACRD2T_14550, partial [Thermoanaerobaculia bacterium]